MKRLACNESLGALMNICSNSTVVADEHDDQGNNPAYHREFQTIMDALDVEGCIEESGHVSEKKRRLSVDQVKALEKNFEVENKLEPERKVKLAQELGLQPRQVAVWFQNRRARWKTKQLERDYGVLKANYDTLKHNFDKLQHDNETLLKEIQELRSKLNEDGESETKVSVKEVEDKCNNGEAPLDSIAQSEEGHLMNIKNNAAEDSDSSAILNEDNINNNSPTAAISSSAGIILHHSPRPHPFIGSTSFKTNGTTASVSVGGGEDAHNHHQRSSSYQPQFVKIEEHNFFGEDSCSTFFSDDQAPTLHWYSEDWN